MGEDFVCRNLAEFVAIEYFRSVILIMRELLSMYLMWFSS